MSDLVHQLFASGADNECPYDIRVSDVRELGALIQETPHELPERFIGLLPIAPKISEVFESHVGALEIPYEDLHQIIPVVDLSLREMF